MVLPNYDGIQRATVARLLAYNAAATEQAVALRLAKVARDAAAADRASCFVRRRRRRR